MVYFSKIYKNLTNIIVKQQLLLERPKNNHNNVDYDCYELDILIRPL